MINIKELSVYLVACSVFRHKLDEIFAKILKRDNKILEKISFRTKYYNQISQDFSALLNANRGGWERINKFPFHKTSCKFYAYKISKYFSDKLLS